MTRSTSRHGGQPYVGVYRESALSDLVRLPQGERIEEIVIGNGEAYRTRFAHWQERASVRVKPYRMLEDDVGDRPYFPPELVPMIAHPLVGRLDPQASSRILVQRLYCYLHFTAELEQLAVIPVASKISRGRAGLALPDAMRQDAYRIVTDEAWHAQFSYDLIQQVAARTGVPCWLPEVPQFVDRLDEIRGGLDPDLHGVEALMFSIVSETLISAILADLPQDGRLPKAVRETVADHAEDEGRHHAYFRSLVRYFWPALTHGQRQQVGPWLPQVIYAFLAPDYRALGHSLGCAGLSPEESAQVLVETYPTDAVALDVAKAARSTIRYFAEVGALEDSHTHDAFAAARLIDG